MSSLKRVASSRKRARKKVSCDAWFFEDATAPPSLSRRETRFELTFQFYRFSLKQSVWEL